MFIIPWGLILITDPGRRGALYNPMLIAFVAFETFRKHEARKEIKEMLGEDNFMDF